MATIYIDFLEYAKGLYSKALILLEAGQCDDFSVISGSIILVVGMEKLTKSVIYKKDPLMILYDKITFDHLHKKMGGENFQGYNTISFEEALKRIVRLYPSLDIHKNDIELIIEKRNLLMHNFGYLDIPNLEKTIQVKVADFTEAICIQCLDSDVEKILGIDIWSKLRNNRDAYNDADRLELDKRINHFKRLLSQQQPLPCSQVTIPNDKAQIGFSCPVCEDEALLAFDIDWSVDFDHREGVYFDAYPYAIPVTLKCECTFTLEDSDETKMILGDQYETLCNQVLDLPYLYKPDDER